MVIQPLFGLTGVAVFLNLRESDALGVQLAVANKP